MRCIGNVSEALLVLAIVVSGCTTVVQKRAQESQIKIASDYPELEKAENVVLPDLQTTGDLNSYLQYAALRNAELRRSFYQWKAALQKIPQASSLPDPKFTYGNFINEVETKVGPQRQKIGISQTFPWYGTLRLKAEKAFIEAEAKRHVYTENRLRLFSQVKDIYFDYYYLGRAQQIFQKNLRLFEEMQELSKTKFDTARMGYQDKIKIDIELDRYRERLETLKDYSKPLNAKFKYRLNGEIEGDLPFPSSIEFNEVELDAEEVFQLALENNPLLKVIDQEIDREEKNISLAKNNYIPTITLGLDYIDTGSAGGNVSDAGKDAIIAMVSFNIPINFSRYRAERLEAEAKRKAAQLNLKDKRLRLYSQLNSALFNMRDAKRKLLLYRDSLIPKGTRSLQVTKAAYQAGKVGYLDFIDAQQALLKFELEYEINLVKYAKSLAKVEKIAGTEVGTRSPSK